ncbi:helicase-associated domain-containing protein [Sulfobacillus harzensis]|uniref:Helicase XPB/Ssl2 N-terminal domain-containing protein n=1 Tax=Sulfobacillus harzensis TaxID=2729629 RepID=A0A7Y0L2Q2_9FIRM|nr:helicase-associated domain-containing protein [Sulfobacillus harzensis]NMP21300.1 hypothetical protein [Sulfobacillus harzensis]
MSSPWVRSLSSILARLSEPEQHDLTTRLGLKGQPLVQALLDPERVSAVVRGLSEDGLHALKVWVAERGFWRNIPRQSRLAAGVDELAAAGLVFETRYGPYQRFLIMPWELMARVLPLLWDIPWDKITVQAEARVKVPAPIWSPFWHDVFQVLSFAREEPLLLTTQGDVYRRLKTKMERRMWDRGSLFPAGVMVDYLLSALYRQGLLASADHPYRYVVNEDAAERLFSQDPAALFSWLAEFVFDPNRNYWPVLLWVSLSSLVPDDRALVRSQAIEWLATLGIEGIKTPYLISQGLGDLLITDFWEPGPNYTGRLSASARAALEGRFEQPQPGESLVQPTGEILVPPTIPLAERWKVDGLASRVRSDRVSTYRLDLNAVKQGIRRGLDAAQHQRQLESMTRTGLPNNVQINLEDWYRAIGRHRLMEVTVVHSSTPEDSRDVETVLGPEVLGRLSPTDLIIGSDRVKEVQKKMEKSGVPILPEVLRPSLPDEDDWVEHYEDPRERFEVHLPRNEAAPSGRETSLKSLIQASQKAGRPLTLTFLAAGDSAPRTEQVIPVALESRWIQAYVLRERRYVLIEWQRILSAAED